MHSLCLSSAARPTMSCSNSFRILVYTRVEETLRAMSHPSEEAQTRKSRRMRSSILDISREVGQ